MSPLGQGHYTTAPASVQPWESRGEAPCVGTDGRAYTPKNMIHIAPRIRKGP